MTRITRARARCELRYALDGALLELQCGSEEGEQCGLVGVGVVESECAIR